MSGAADRLFTSAKHQFAAKQFEAAATTLESLLLLDPAHARARLLLVAVYLRLDRYTAARGHALAVAARPATDAALEFDLFQKLRGFNEHTQMIASGERLLAANSLDILQWMQLASSLSAIGADALAGEVAQRMRATAPRHPATCLTDGYLATHRGDFAAAESALEAGIAADARLPMAHWLLSRLRSQRPESNHVARLRKLVADPVLGPADAALVGFALHKELHDLGEYGPAWVALEKASSAKRKVTPYDEAETVALFDALEAIGAGGARAVDPNAPVPVFIVGMHRTGTTLLERMLGRHPQVVDCGETYRFTAQLRAAADHHCRGVIDAAIVRRADRLDHARIGADYTAACRWRLRADATHFTEKLPSNFLAIGLIKRALPHARILHMQRDPIDTCLSNLRELFSDACAYSYDQGELARYYLRYQRLMAHWHRLYPGQILDVRYEDLVADPETQARRVIGYCALPWRDECIDHAAHAGAVTTASAVQVRAPIHRRSVGAWRSYEQQLEPLRRILGV